MTQVSGGVFVRLPDGSIGRAVAGATLEFIKEDRTTTSTARSSGQGRYSIILPPGRYYVRATHAAYEDYTSAPEFMVATGPSHTTNFFLRPPQITTVIVMRHGEKLDPDSNAASNPLSETGRRRALFLPYVLFQAGVTRIFHTNTVRSRDTAKPLAEALQLEPTVYTYPTSDQVAQQVAQHVLQNNRGDVVLVMAHGESVQQVVTALGASASIGPVDFDNMFVVSRAGSDVNVLNLQYFLAGQPNRAENSAHAMTVILVGVGGASARAAQFEHAVGGAGVSAIFVSQNRTAMVSPLATLLEIPPENYEPTQVLQLVERLLADYQSATVVVSGTDDDLRAMIRHLGGRAPNLYSNHMIVLTRFSSGAVRVLPMRL